MSASERRKVKGVIRSFLDQLAAHFDGRSQPDSTHGLVIVAGKCLVPVSVGVYCGPHKTQPTCPTVLRICAGVSSLPPTSRLRKLGTLVERTKRFPGRLELSLLTQELIPITRWFAEWIQAQADAHDSLPTSSVQFDGDALIEAGRRWREVTYLWSANAKTAYEAWVELTNAKRADETQFGTRVFHEKYPQIKTRRNPPTYVPPDSPRNWFTKRGTRFASMFRPDGPTGKYLFGADVDVQVKRACERGYIVVPSGWKSSAHWRAWSRTWWEYCQLPNNRRPFLQLIIGKRLRDGRCKITLNWDWITMDPASDPSEDPVRDPRSRPDRAPKALESWKRVEKCILRFYQALPEAERRRLCGTKSAEPHLGPSVGRISCFDGDDKPVRLVVNWIARHYPR